MANQNNSEDSQIFTIGYIPENHSGNIIQIGDPATSGTLELNFVIQENTSVTAFELPDFFYDGVQDDWFFDAGKLWNALAKATEKCIEVAPCASLIAHAWAYLQHEGYERSLVRGLETEFGEFYNKNKTFNGKWYFRLSRAEGMGLNIAKSAQCTCTQGQVCPVCDPDLGGPGRCTTQLDQVCVEK